MPSSGKPVFNPFASPQTSDAGSLQRENHPGVEKPLRPESLRGRRGISLVGTSDQLPRLPFQRATMFSAAAHIIAPIVLVVTSLLVLLILSWLLHFNFWDLFRAKAPPQDMEFTLVADTKATRPDKPLFKGNFNQRAGGKQNHKQPIKATEAPPQSSAASKAQTPAPKQAEQTPTLTQAAKPKPKPKKQEKAEKPRKVPSIPLSKAPEPEDNQATEAAEAQQQAAANAQSEAPQVASIGDMMAGINSHSALGNPQDGDAKTPGVDVAEDVDFGPFMADLERRIKRNWAPPRGRESRKVTLKFYLARDGRVIKIETMQSSGNEETDRAAIASVEASAPFQAFPPQVKEDILPVEFTFDYNVLNPKNPKQALKW